MIACFAACSKSAQNGETKTTQGAEATQTTKAENENKTFSRTVTLSSGSEMTFTIEVDKVNVLKLYTQNSVFKASSQKSYEDTCKEYSETVNSENAEGYKFRTSEFKSDDEKLEAIIIREWDVEKNTEVEKMPEMIEKYLNDDGTIDVKGWEAQFDAVENSN